MQFITRRRNRPGWNTFEAVEIDMAPAPRIDAMSPSEYAERVAIERRHDPDAVSVQVRERRKRHARYQRRYILSRKQT